MSPTRLVLRGERIDPGETLVPEPPSRHARASRVASGEPVELLDLAGAVGIGRLVAWEGGRCRVEVERVVRERGEPPAPLVLALAVLHTDAFAWAVEKATELGATRVVPVLAGRVQGREHARRTERWQRVADAAVAQCGRSRPPLVTAPEPLAGLLAAAHGTRLVADPEAARALEVDGADPQGITLLVGPEGGLSAEEREDAARAGFAGLNLGPRTLRAETAAVAGLALVQRLAGWI